MKKISILLICVLILTLVGCGNKQTVKVAPQIKVTAQSIVNKLKTKEANYMTGISIVTAANDENKLLGRPNQYTEKITWNDNRAINASTNCTIEVFNNKEDATSRKTYIDAVTKSMPTLIQYTSQKDNTLLRIEGALTPTQSKEYMDIFNTK